MKERLVDPGLLGDLLHAGAGGAAPDEHAARGVEDALLGERVRGGIGLPACAGGGLGGRRQGDASKVAGLIR
jgi:hypothetical protein